jgi:hypothetical protein
MRRPCTTCPSWLLATGTLIAVAAPVCSRSGDQESHGSIAKEAVRPPEPPTDVGTRAEETAVLVGLLRDEAAKRRELSDTMRGLGGDSAISLLSPLLEEHDQATSELAADLLEELDNARADELVVRYALRNLGDAKAVNASTGGRRLLGLDGAAIVILCDIYGRTSPDEMQSSSELGGACGLLTELLAEWRGEAIRSVLEACLQVQDSDVARSVGWAWAQWGGSAEYPQFVSMVESRDLVRQVAAISALETLHDLRAVRPLLAALTGDTALREVPGGPRGPVVNPNPQMGTPGPVTRRRETIADHVRRALDALTGEEFDGDVPRLEAWVRANTPLVEGTAAPPAP